MIYSLRQRGWMFRGSLKLDGIIVCESKAGKEECFLRGTTVLERRTDSAMYGEKVTM